MSHLMKYEKETILMIYGAILRKSRNSLASSAEIYLYMRQKSPYTCDKIKKIEKTEVMDHEIII